MSREMQDIARVVLHLLCDAAVFILVLTFGEKRYRRPCVRVSVALSLRGVLKP